MSSEEEEFVSYWWDADEVFDADISAALDLQPFTSELIAFLLKLLEENPELRPRIDKLCDHSLYQDLVTLKHFIYPLIAAGVNPAPSEPMGGELIRLTRRVTKSYLNMDEYDVYRSGSIATALREALGYDPSVDMGDEDTRRMCRKELEVVMGEIRD